MTWFSIVATVLLSILLLATTFFSMHSELRDRYHQGPVAIFLGGLFGAGMSLLTLRSTALGFQLEQSYFCLYAGMFSLISLSMLIIMCLDLRCREFLDRKRK